MKILKCHLILAIDKSQIAVVRPLGPQRTFAKKWWALKVLNVLKLMGKHFIDPKRSEILSVFQVIPCTTQIALFCQNCSLPFSLRSLDIPALLTSWQKHYLVVA
jgi:hypothetical protein